VSEEEKEGKEKDDTPVEGKEKDDTPAEGKEKDEPQKRARTLGIELGRCSDENTASTEVRRFDRLVETRTPEDCA
jgi:hypothetical protein